MNVTIHDDHKVDDNERFEIQLSHIVRSPTHIGDLKTVGVTILEKEG